MRTFLLTLLCSIFLFMGCMTRMTYTEGLSVSAGVYIPSEGQTYGLQLCNYVSGVRLATSTNANLKINRSANVNNSFLFGLISNSETNKTEITVQKEKFQIDGSE